MILGNRLQIPRIRYHIEFWRPTPSVYRGARVKRLSYATTAWVVLITDFRHLLTCFVSGGFWSMDRQLSRVQRQRPDDDAGALLSSSLPVVSYCLGCQTSGMKFELPKPSAGVKKPRVEPTTNQCPVAFWYTAASVLPSPS